MAILNFSAAMETLKISEAMAMLNSFSAMAALKTEYIRSYKGSLIYEDSKIKIYLLQK